jgi:hypothetical protein
MKVLRLVFLLHLSVAVASAFVVVSSPRSTTSVVVWAAAPRSTTAVTIPRHQQQQLDATTVTNQAIQAALQASKRFGPTSVEARLAWDVVEQIEITGQEVHQNDSSTLMDHYSDWMAHHHFIDEEYELKKEQLAKMVESMNSEHAHLLEQIKTLAKEMKAVKVKKIKKKALPPASQQALEEVLAVVHTYGKDSEEARKAWQRLEQVTAAETNQAMAKRLDQKCLIDSTVEACMALEQLNRVIHLDKTRYDTIGLKP